MKNKKVNPKRLKIGVIYKFTGRTTGDEYWEFLGHGVTRDVYKEERYIFKQVHGSWFADGIVILFNNFEMMSMFYMSREDKVRMITRVL